METEILVKNLCKKYPPETEALKSVDLEISKGQFFTLLGPNGAGKSTLINILTTLIKGDTGEVRISGMNPEADGVAIRNMIGVASQDNEIDPLETPENLLIFQARLFGLSKKEAAERADELIALFQLSKERKKKANALSGGNLRRLHCSLALVHRPKILFLDEPTVGMDPIVRANFWEAISNLHHMENITVFLTTQYLEEADKHAMEMALLIEGEIHYSGTISDFKKTVHPEKDLSLDDSYQHYIRKIFQPSKTLNQEEERK